MKILPTAYLLLLTVFISGCATVKGPGDPNDPLESYNRAVHSFNKSFDEAIATPVAKAYQKVTPDFVDKSITNFFSNLDDVIVFFNDLLQFKFKQAASDLTRFLVNSTIGVFGILDPATSMGLRKHNEDFGQTLGYWGVPAGPYFVLPFLGPSTIRDTAGLTVDTVYFDPVVNYYDDLKTRYFFKTIHYIDVRADLLGASRLVETAALDEYVFIREAYLQRRQYHVYDGDPPMEDFDDEEETIDQKESKDLKQKKESEDMESFNQF